MSPTEFARRLSPPVHPKTVYVWLTRGLIKARRVGPRLIDIPESEIGRLSKEYVPPSAAPAPSIEDRLNKVGELLKGPPAPKPPKKGKRADPDHPQETADVTAATDGGQDVPAADPTTPNS